MSTTAHPTIPEFDYIKPSTLEEASKFLKEHIGEARPLAGGTDSFVRMRDGFWKEKFLVDVKHLPNMDKLEFDPQEGLKIGAAVSMNRIAQFDPAKEFYPLLAEAAESVASYQLRTRATLVGNICNASPAGDTLGACLLLDAKAVYYSDGEEKRAALTDFFKGPGKTILEPGEIVTSIEIPAPPEGSVGVYHKHGRNNASDLAIVGISVLAYPNTAVKSGFTFKLALASVAPIPLAVPAVEEYLAGTEIDEAALDKAGEIAMDSCKPIDDVRSSALYRSMMVRNLSARALKQAWKLLEANKQ